jgi:hypothetical protein
VIYVIDVSGSMSTTQKIDGELDFPDAIKKKIVQVN